MSEFRCFCKNINGIFVLYASVNLMEMVMMMIILLKNGRLLMENLWLLHPIIS